MATRLEEDEIRDIIEAYDEHGNMNTVASETQHSTSTISKYVNWWQDGIVVLDDDGGVTFDEDAIDEWLAERDEPDTPEGYTAEPPRGAGESDDPDFENMSDGDFIRWFFDQDGFGVKRVFANTLARVCDIRGGIPGEAEMADELATMDSGISNRREANRVAEVYWDAATDFMWAKDRSYDRLWSPRQGGTWVSPSERSAPTRAVPGQSQTVSGRVESLRQDLREIRESLREIGERPRLPPDPDETDDDDTDRTGSVLGRWFRCPVCGSSDVSFDGDFEHWTFSCGTCGTETTEWVEDLTSGRVGGL